MLRALFGWRRRHPQQLRLGVEPLEQRRLLAVDVLGTPMSTFVGPFASNVDGQLTPPGAYTASATAGQSPAAQIVNYGIGINPVHPGATDVLLSDLLGWSPTGSYAELDALIVVPAEGSIPFDGNVDHLSLWGDLDGRPDNGYETLLSTAEPQGDVAILERFSRSVFVGRGHYPAFQIRADVTDSLDGDYLGVQVATAEFSDLRGKPFADHRISHVGTPTLLPIEIISGELTIIERMQGATDVAVANQKNVPLVRFEAIASGADVLVTDVSFVAEEGNLQSANNYSLWVDTNSDGNVDTVLQHGVSASQGRVTFSSLANGGYVIPSSAFPTSFEVHADIASSPPSNILQLNFAATDAVMAELTANGNSLDVDDIHLDSSAESTVYTLVASGDLYVQQSSTPIRSQDLLGGTLADTVLRLTLHAEYEPVDVTRLSFSLSNTTALRSVDWLELYKPGSTTPFAIANVSQTLDGIGHFTARMNGHQLTIGKGEGQDVLVRPRMKSDEQGSVSGDTFAVSVARVEARGLASGNTLVQNDGDSTSEGEVIVGRSTAGPNLPISGPIHTVVHAKIVSITNANPDPNGSAISSGVQPTGQFKLTTAAHNNTKNGSNDVVVDQLSFVVNATNVLLSTDDFALYDKANNILRQNGARFETLGGQPIVGSTITGTFRVVFDQISGRGVVNSAIDMGTNKTFVVQTTVLNPKIANTNSTLQVSLETDRIVWFDMDSSSQIERTGINYPDSIVHSTSYQS